MNPTISVVVLTYNQESTIARTLDSILAQKTDYPFEIIIGEDASPNDNTRRVCEEYVTKYPSVIRLLPKADNKGLLINYRDCLAECRGKYIAVCAGDDWWHNPCKLQLQGEYLDKNEQCALVYTDYNIYKTRNGMLINNVLTKESLSSKDTRKLILHGFFLPPLTIMYRKDLLADIDFEDYVARGYMTEDVPMFLDFSLKGTLDYIDISTATYTAASGSISQFDDATKMEHFLMNIKKIKLDFITSNPQTTAITAEQLEQIYAHHILWGAFALKDRNMVKKYAPLLSQKSIKERLAILACQITPMFWLYSWFRKIV